MTTMFFLRHGPTKENLESRIQGQQPGTLLLSETERYITAVVPLLRQKNPTILISSDLDRAVGTRDVLRNFLQVPDVEVAMSPLLREKAMGFYEGMLWAEVPEILREQRGQQVYDFRKFGGENDDDVRVRVTETLRRFAQQYPSNRICLITHAGWLKQLVAMADREGVLPDGWTDRTAIYEAGIGPIGQMQYFHPIRIEAELPSGD